MSVMQACAIMGMFVVFMEIWQGALKNTDIRGLNGTDFK